LHHNDATSYSSFFTREFFTKKYVTVVPHPTFLFHRLRTKLKTRNFDAIEVIEAESQAMMYTLSEQDFQDAFKTWQKRWRRCIGAEGNCFEGDDGQ
jgi:23S rRNA maturation mini-RNase III